MRLPQLHTHAVIFNVTEREDGSTRALDPKAFFESQTYATAVYQSHLMYRLRELGYELERGRSGAPEIKGYSQEYLDFSSPRSEKIREHLERVGRSGPEAAQIAAHATREKKQDLTKEQVLQAHKNMASDFGNQADRVIAEARQRVNEHSVRPQSPIRAQEAMTFARDHLFEREAVADERAIMTTALRRGMGEATFSEVRNEFTARRENGKFRGVGQEKYGSSQRFTTPETLAAERANIQAVQTGKNSLAPMMTEREAFAEADTRGFLNASQRRVVHEVLTSQGRVHGLQGLAGSGKTTTLKLSAKARKRRATRSRDSPPHPVQQGSSAMQESRLPPCKAFLLASWMRTPASPGFTCWMNPRSPLPNRCGPFSKRWPRRTAF